METTLHNPDELTFEQLREENEALKIRLAEEKLKLEQSVTGSPFAFADDLKLLHELQVHQLEMEMQNAELRSSHFIQEKFDNKYNDLFEFAPYGYFTLNLEGVIQKANLTGTTLLGVNRSVLIKTKFEKFILNDSKEKFQNCLSKLIETRTRQICEVKIFQPNGQRLFLKIALSITKFENTIQILLAATDITIEIQIEDTQSFLLGYSWSKTGHDFFEELAEYLYKSLGVDYVCIDKLMEEGREAQTVAVYFDGKFEDNVRYALEDTPCGKVSGQQVCCFPNKVRNLFPQDEVLQEMVAESYAGITLWGSEGTAIGLIAVIGRKPLVDIKFTELVLKQVSIRAASELEHRQAEEVLRKSEAQRKAILESAMDGFWITDMNGCFLEVNESYCRMSGYSKEELLTMKIADIEFVESADEIESRIKNIIVKGEDHFESKHRRKDGSFFDIEANVQFQSIEGGQFVVFLHDITQRKKHEIAIKESEERFSKAFNFSPMSINIFSLSDGRSVNINEAYLSLIGYSREEVVGHTSVELNLLVNPEDRDKWMTTLREGKTIENLEVVIRKKTGNLVNVLMSLTLIEINGETMGLIQAVDITERKKAEDLLRQSEARYRAIFERNLSIMMLIDPDTAEIKDVNQAACDYYGWNYDEFLTKYVSDINLISKEEAISKMQNAKNEIQNHFIFKHRLSNAEIRDVEVYSCPLEYNGKIALFSIIHDITESKKLEEALRESEYFFRESQRAAFIGSYKADFVSNKWESSEVLNQIFGIDENYDKNMKGWLDLVHLDDRQFMNHYLADEVLSKGAEFNNEYRIVRQSDGEVRWVLGLGKVDFDNKRNVISLVGTIQDITKRKQHEEAISQSEQRLKFHFENSPLGVVEWDSDFIVTQWSAEAEHIFGYTKEETLGKRIETLNLIYEEDIPIVAGAMIRLTSGVEQTLVSSNRNVTKAGEIIETVWYNSVLLDESRKMSSVISLVQDITLQKNAEEALVKMNEELEQRVKERTVELHNSHEIIKIAEEKYRTVADFAANWEFWIDHNDVMLYCSPSCERMTGYKPEDFIANRNLMYDIIHPDDMHDFSEHQQTEMNAHVCEHEIQYKIIRKDGTIRWIGHFCQPVFDDAGIFKGTRGSNKDITARKKIEALLIISNQKYKLLSENINDGIFICNNGSLEYLNKAVYDIFGYEGKELEGIKLTSLISSDNTEKLETILYTNDFVNRSLTIELECFRKDLSVISVEVLLNYVAKEKMVYGVIHDITEKKQVQKNIVKAIIETEESEKAYFSKELHDGLGPLLSTIKLYLQWSERSKTDESRIEIIHKAEEILEEALSTVREVSGKLSPHLLTNYGLNSAIKSFIEKISQSSEINFVFESNLNKRLEPEVEASLYRAVIECINNSIKHSGAKNIEIIIDCSVTTLNIKYKDDGIGFDLKETFEKHKGLGLFNLLNRIENIGGKLNLSSQQDLGVNYQFVINI